MKYHYQTQGSCSRELTFDLRDGRIHDIAFAEGCKGNLKAVALLAEGMEAAALSGKLRGLTCGTKPTSCGDQLAVAIEGALASEEAAAKGSCGCSHAPGSCGGNDCGCAAGA
ncbi:MAG: TIGR03905 family TSCPD domain-containing protein [Treponema sp.]|nr:TIGR03905 family TSCPD domain-containing protein [Treponema sp.]